MTSDHSGMTFIGLSHCGPDPQLSQCGLDPQTRNFVIAGLTRITSAYPQI
jgi:hypothetical protein